MLLYIVRHAWAEERDEHKWPDDSLRPLTDVGEKRFKKLVKQLTEVRFAPEVIATSPLVRCQQTAEIIAKRFPSKPGVVPLEALAPNSNLEALVQWTAELQNDEVAWVGHDPDVCYLAARLIGSGDAAIRFRKGAIAAIRFEEPIGLGKGALQWLATAKLLGV
ncbi:MAG TPA: phosphohistidine phosphatase SixA [Pirellulales bacterium]|jgi:phosphohistidine phosphatase|nr:phosphohistidine phosphatase SixA [Pirellulales bacterium]